MPDEIETTMLNQIKEHATDLKAAHAERDADYEDYEEAYLMDWEDKNDPRLKNMRIVTSTTARDRVEGATRMMIATDPAWAVTTTEEKIDTDKLEKWLDSTWDAAGRAAKNPIHYDLIRSALLYSEMVAAVTPTAELVQNLKKREEKGDRISKATRAAAEQMAEETPFLVEAWNPHHGYPEWDALGLAGYYRCTKQRIGEIESHYGKLPGDKNRYDYTNLHVWYDREYTAVWTDEDEIMCKPHELPVIPIMAQLVDGSRLFVEPQDQRHPLLYGLIKSGIWHNENLVLTVMYSLILGMGAKPKFIYTQSTSTDDDDGPDFNWDDDIITVPNGAQFAPLLNKGMLPPELTEALNLAQRMGMETTIYPQAFGAPAERNTTFSETSLLQQSGRLPLIGTQRKGGWGIGEIGKIMLMLGKAESSYLKGTTLKAEDIPSKMHVEAKLDVKLPQDKLQQANVAKMLAQGDDPLVSHEWVLDNVLGLGQPEEEVKKIWNEQAAKILYAQGIQALVQQAQAQQQQQQMAQRQPPPQGQPPEGQPQEMQAGPMMPQGQGRQIQGMPPQQAGMMPGAGQGMVPPEGGMNG